MVRRWVEKFRVAFAGLFWALGDQNSFYAHITISTAVVVLATTLDLPLWQWIALILAMGGVFTAELLNTAIEQLVAVLHPQHDPRIGRALDVAAAAVLIASASAVVVGLLILGPAIYRWWMV